MSQAPDYTVDNSTGANVRIDLNAIFGAIATNNSAGSDNGSIQNLGFFADTSLQKLRLKEATGNNFVNLRGFDGSLPLPDGTNLNPSLFFDDDPNTGIFSSAADTFNVATGGVERMELGATTIFNESGADVDFRIEGDTRSNLFHVDAGNDRIGIDRSAPDAVFHIFDNAAANDRAALKLEAFRPKIRLQDRTGSSHSAEILCDGNALRFNISVPSDDTTNLSELMRIDSSGQVGIGTTSPTTMLHVQQSAVTNAPSRSSVLYLENNANCEIQFVGNSSNDCQLRFGTSSNTFKGAIEYELDNNNLEFVTNGSERMRLDSSGSLLMGTTSSAGFDSFGSNSGGIILDNVNSSNTLLLATHDTVKFFYGVDASHAYLWCGSNHPIRIATDNAERMRISSNGNFLVGRTGTINVDGKICNHVFEQLASTNFALGVHCEKSTQRGIGIFYTSGQSASDFMFCEVSGSIKFELKGNGGFANVQSNDVNLSDVSVKKNITDATSTIDQVKQWKIKEFHLTDDEDSADKRFGVVAQDMETVDPKLVTEYGSNLKGVKEQQIYWKAIKCLQEAITKIEVLETKVAALEAA